MRVTVVTPWLPVPGSAESGIFVLRDARALAAAGHEVRFVHLDMRPGAAAETDAVEGVPVTRVPFRRTEPSTWRAVQAAVREHAADADVVHTHALPSIIPFAVRRPAPRPWVHTEHWSGITAPETLTPRGRLSRRALLPMLRRPGIVITPDDRLAAAVQRIRGTRPTRVVPCIVAPPPRIVDAPGGGRLRLVAVGALIPRKGPLRAVETVAELGRRGIDAVLTWVGDGPQRDEVVAAADRLGVADRVRLTGRLDEAGVAAEFDAADMFILPTLGDNFCIAVAEALSHGRPVVSGADTGATGYADPEFSEFVAEQTATAYADAVVRLRARTAGIPAREIVETVAGRFTPGRVAELLEAAYRDAGVSAS